MALLETKTRVDYQILFSYIILIITFLEIQG